MGRDERVDGTNELLVQRILVLELAAHVRAQLPELAQAQFPAMDGAGNLDIDESADHAAQYYGDHAPETHGNDPTELKSGMKQDKQGTNRTEEDVEFEPVLERAHPGQELVALAPDVGEHPNQDHQ